MGHARLQKTLVRASENVILLDNVSMCLNILVIFSSLLIDVSMDRVHIIFGILTVLIIGAVIVSQLSTPLHEGYVSKHDEEVAKLMAEQLENDLMSGAQIEELTPEQLQENADRILLVKKKVVKEGFHGGHGGGHGGHWGRGRAAGRWGNNWIYQYPQYSDAGTYPYAYVYPSDAWPPGLYSSVYNFSPGFATNGWSWYLRPKLYNYYPKGRWVVSNGEYYYLN